jgi:cytochrome P450 PksS
MVLPFMSSANRDPRQFEAADTLDIRRAPTRHVAFAYGLHFCLGAPLARLEGQLTFDILLRRFPGLALTSAEPRWKPMIFLRGLESLFVTWDASRAR